MAQINVFKAEGRPVVVGLSEFDSHDSVRFEVYESDKGDLVALPTQVTLFFGKGEVGAFLDALTRFVAENSGGR